MGDAGRSLRTRARGWALAVVLACAGLQLGSACIAAAQLVTPRRQPATPLRLVGEVSATQVSVVIDEHAAPVKLAAGQRVGAWTFMGGVAGDPSCAAFEDFEQMDGNLLLLDARGVRSRLGKTSEDTFAKPESLHLGHTPEALMASPVDLLGTAILARHGVDDPDYAEVASVFSPIKKLHGDVHAFVGTSQTAEKVAFQYGGRSPSFDPALVSPEVEAVVKAGRVRHGLVGGSLPVLRFVYPDQPGSYTELLAFAPQRMVNGNPRHQPVWYRVARVEHGKLRFTKYVDTYQVAPPFASPDPAAFYADLLQLSAAWQAQLAGAMQLELPDERLSNLARVSLIRAISTRVGDYPQYGVFDRNYGGAEHDGFPDTFAVETSAMIAWGLLPRAGAYVDNYFERFVRDDGSVLYRGPEIGQFGRMLSVLAEYAEHGGDAQLLLARRSRIDALTRVLLVLRQQALKLPAASPAHGLIAGYSEADSCLEPNPARYLQPYFSNSMLAARGFSQLGRVWARLGSERGDAGLRAWGERLQAEGEALARDVALATARSMLEVDGARVLPSIAGVRVPHDVAVKADPGDPQFRAYRAYNEMMLSGMLTPEQLRGIVDYRTRHHDLYLGMPTAYNKPELAGFLAYGYGYGLVQGDMIREALLLLYAMSAHQYTRGAWIAPETRLLFDLWDAAPYATPAQLFEPLMLRWLLVFEDPLSETLWLGRGLPRAWLEDGKSTRVADAPTRWGKVSFRITSHVKDGAIAAELQLPAAGVAATIKLRLRTPTHKPIASVLLDGQPWTALDRDAEVIELPAGRSGKLSLEVRY